MRGRGRGDVSQVAGLETGRPPRCRKAHCFDSHVKGSVLIQRPRKGKVVGYRKGVSDRYISTRLPLRVCPSPEIVSKKVIFASRIFVLQCTVHAHGRVYRCDQGREERCWSVIPELHYARPPSSSSARSPKPFLPLPFPPFPPPPSLPPFWCITC